MPATITRPLLALLVTATAASAAELAADARPPPFFPQRADNLVLRGMEAGGPASLAALDGLPCRGNACDGGNVNQVAPAMRGECDAGIALGGAGWVAGRGRRNSRSCARGQIHVGRRARCFAWAARRAQGWRARDCPVGPLSGKAMACERRLW